MLEGIQFRLIGKNILPVTLRLHLSSTTGQNIPLALKE